ncbi:MAG: recombinase family protein [Erysipelotrichales bacterium]|nr:recombinase family protein [Erysipelotrichales bacterium]
MTFAYLRVSTVAQNLDIQKEALKKYKIDKWFEEKASGKTTARQELQKVLEFLREDDTLVIYDLSRLGRDTAGVTALFNDFNQKGINLISHMENIDIKSTSGKLIADILVAVAEMNRKVQNEKVREGIAAARARGRFGGRPKTSDAKLTQAFALYDSQNFSVTEICKITGICKATLYNHVKTRNGKATD